ncbi:DUF6392 family protein [Pseudomonas sp. BBP2017]|uniref:DUF6392 family protein n=1 Tax=Pseudomonas sp. BBP2017 TaxID=2109731 RepID=UPI000D131E3F|nr:DUF6392 family protein [Pseudomonas sp. BBP2017]PSS57377.1 hypothetical protein C6382_10765 [Pseudomonas sp. BBP2017]
MNSAELEVYLRSLGRGYDELVEEGVVEKSRFIEVYPGALTLYISIEAGFDLAFVSETKEFEAIFLTLRKLVTEEPIFIGTLPEPYGFCRNRDEVHRAFGVPRRSKEAFRMPDPLGKVGGWDAYELEGERHRDIEIVFKYDVNLNVTCLAFSLKRNNT